MLKAKFRFRPGHRDVFHGAPAWKLTTLFLNLTERCNLDCRYCHSGRNRGGETMPLQLVERVLDQAAAIGSVTIALTGGEPLLYPQIAEVLRLLQDRELPCKIATNGTFLDDDRLDLLRRTGVKSLQVSLDTVDASLYAEMKGISPQIHAEVLAGIRRTVEAGAFHVVVSSVVHRRSREALSDALRYCHDAGVDTFTAYRLIPYGKAQGEEAGMPTEEEFQAVLEDLLAQFEVLPQHWAVDLAFPWASGSAFLNRWKDRLDVRPFGCIAGKSSMTILADGAAAPCVCFGAEPVRCGNIRETPLETLWNAPPMRFFRGEEPVEGCEGCPEFAFCRGGCRTLAWLASGRPDAGDPVCRIWRCETAAAQAQPLG